MHDNSYFSDITDLFLKAKNAENIEVDQHSKAATREMLSYKIEQMKEIAAPSEEQPSFWNKWKKQLIGVPASVLAVFVIVFALQNTQIDMPQEDFAPENQTSETSSEPETVKDAPLIEDAQIPEQREVKIKPLIIDYGDNIRQDSALSQTFDQRQPQQTTVTDEPKISTGGGPTTTTTSNIEPLPAPGVEEEAPATSPEPEPEPKTEPSDNFTYIKEESDAPAETIQPVEKIEPTQTAEPMQIVEPIEQIQPAEEIPTKKVQDIIQDNILIETDEKINHFREPISPTTPDFDKSALEKLEITDNLSDVNVHYLNEDQAAVEVITNGESRWYLYEEINGNWTVTQKFD
jgi:hypothetical protein